MQEALRERPGLTATPSQANVLWLRADGMPGAELAARMERTGVVVAGGGPLGDPDRVRVRVPHRPGHGERLLRALDLAVGAG